MNIGVCLVLLWAKDPLGSCDTNCITLQLRTQTFNYNIITYSEKSTPNYNIIDTGFDFVLC